MADTDFQGVPLAAPATQTNARGFDPRNEHPEYRANKESWQTTRDVYEGAEGVIPRAKDYVPQRKMGESDDAYLERLALLHPAGLLGVLIDSLVGLWARKTPDEDEWGELGAEMESGDLEPGSLGAKLVEDADRRRMTWENHRRAVATMLMTYRVAYEYVDTNKPPTAAGTEMDAAQARAAGVRPYVTRIAPLDLLDWIEEDGRKVEAVIREHVDTRTSLDAGKGDAVDRYLRLTLNGWQRYTVEGSGPGAKIVAGDSGTYRYQDADGRPRLPLVEARLPTARYGAYNLALIERVILNHDSHLDALLRAACVGQYLTVQGDETEVADRIRKGIKVFTYARGDGAPAFISHLIDAASPTEQRIEKLTAAFWTAAMYEFSDRAAQKTATEIEQEWAGGIGAFLTLLAGAMTEAENEAKYLLAQAAGLSNGGSTKFSTDYKVEDVLAELERIKALFFGLGGDIPMSGRLKAVLGAYVVKRADQQLGVLAGVEGLDVDAEVQAATDQAELERQRISGLEAEMARQPGFPEEQVAA